MRHRGVKWVVALAITACGVPAAAQDLPAGQQARPDVVIEGVAKPDPYPDTELKPVIGPAIRNRRDYETSQQIAKCAVRASLPKIREAIDGEINSATQRAAQAWLVRRTATCNPAGANLTSSAWGVGVRSSSKLDVPPGGAAEQEALASVARAVSPYFGNSIDGSSVLDRGALIEEVFEQFVPDLSLTREQTGDLAVQARFNALETGRNRLRLKADYRYFETAVCLVRLQPRLAVQLVRSSPGSLTQRRTQATLVNRARICVGNAKRVTVDGTEFRIYIADALYRWVVATRGVETLVPEETALRTD